jgi:hypothetical protein
MTSILELDYVEQKRPYSQKELQDNREGLYRYLRLGKSRVQHEKCDHFYKVRENGRKEKEMKEKDSNDVGNCSVCWKLSKTSRYLYDEAQDMVEAYHRIFEKEPKYLHYDSVDIENVFYKWLNEDMRRK